MAYRVIATPKFGREVRHLGKEYRSLPDDTETLIEQLETEPTMGTGTGQGCYKIRRAITSKNKGKSGDARVIAHIRVVENTVFLLSIYDNSEQEDIADDDLNQRLAGLDEQLLT